MIDSCGTVNWTQMPDPDTLTQKVQTQTIINNKLQCGKLCFKRQLKHVGLV